MYPTPPISPVSSDPGATSLDEDEGFDTEKDQGLMNILSKIRALTNASVMELKSYKSPPAEVISVCSDAPGSVVALCYMVLSEALF